MRWSSTRGGAPPVTFQQALFDGLAPDGGLYLPQRLTAMPAPARDRLRGRSLPEVGSAIASHLIGGEIEDATLSRLIHAALDFPVPLVPVGPCAALELFHGPTFAFKDVGARVMARLMAHFVTAGDSLTVLVATSGDTGSAVAQAFAGVRGTRVVVLYPLGQVSDVQEAQFATLGGNVQAVAVEGTFDDCQALVKQAFADPAVRRQARLTSANSINVGRLVPQAFYYAWASLQSADAAPAIFSVPSGNFGNLTAGLLAKRLGFPIAGFVAATNVNDVVPQYLATGRYEPRPSIRTLANAMDVGAPSNFERIRTMYGDDVAALRRDVRAVVADDAQVTAAMADVHARHGYLLDPHSAIAWLGLHAAAPPAAGAAVFAATAHPAKFRETVEPAVGRRVELPPALRDALARPRLTTRIAPRFPELADLLR